MSEKAEESSEDISSNDTAEHVEDNMLTNKIGLLLCDSHIELGLRLRLS